MVKLLEESVGHLEYLLLGLTFLGVLYLVMKQANYSIHLQRSGLQIGPGDVAWAAQRTHPGMGPDGFSSGGMEQPVWFSSPFNEASYAEVNQAGNVGTGSVDITADRDANGGAVQFAAWGTQRPNANFDTKVSAHTTQMTTLYNDKEGYRQAPWAKSASGFQSSLDGALYGANTSLAHV
jgi:hypothetical protein